ncbi:MAG: hypothetical protein NVS3B5_17690 [Sphingomicrobium sp.]
MTENTPVVPLHYTRYKIEPLDFIMQNNLSFPIGNIIKYVCRHDLKDGVTDLKKARQYLDRLIHEESKRAAAVKP